MKTVFPTATGCSGTHLVGLRKAPVGNGAQRVGTFILKREYNIVGNTLVPATVTEGIRFVDLTEPPREDIPDSNASYIFVLAEKDLAVFKPFVDVVVEGSYVDEDDCELWVSSGGSAQLWFARTGETPVIELAGDETAEDEEALRNMFGWQPRHLAPRSTQGTITTDPAEPTELQDPDLDIEDVTFDYSAFDNEYFNGFRRTWQVTHPASQLAANASITINRQREAVSSTWQFDLADEQLSAHFFVHDGVSADKERNWCRRPIHNIKLDTVVVSPEQQRAFLVWRGFWPYDAYPEDHYRMLKVSLEAQ